MPRGHHDLKVPGHAGELAVKFGGESGIRTPGSDCMNRHGADAQSSRCPLPSDGPRIRHAFFRPRANLV